MPGTRRRSSDRHSAFSPVEFLPKILILISSCFLYEMYLPAMASMERGKKKRVYFEDVKAKHTTHWDLDYLSRDELEALYRKNREQGAAGERKSNEADRRKPAAAAAAVIAAVVLIGVLIYALSR